MDYLMLIQTAFRDRRHAESDDLLAWYVSSLSGVAQFFWLLTVMLLGLYALGNFQGFLDETLLSLLRATRVTAFISMLFAMWLQVGVLVRALSRRRGLISGSLVALII
ncbi:MAG: hypothetical protein LC641_04925 [Spirochaeta sp.]|nr:hypothetical protein [Spirochaeta sp.]